MKWRKQPKGGGRGREATKLNQAKNRGFFLSVEATPFLSPPPLLHLPDLHKYASQIAHNVGTNSQMMIMRVDK